MDLLVAVAILSEGLLENIELSMESVLVVSSGSCAAVENTMLVGQMVAQQNIQMEVGVICCPEVGCLSQSSWLRWN
jgi:hypothetical protein